MKRKNIFYGKIDPHSNQDQVERALNNLEKRRAKLGAKSHYSPYRFSPKKPTNILEPNNEEQET
jgi:hypothetical protein